jgi:hypothetical protein
MFVKKVFNIYEYKKNAEFYADLKSVEIIGKSVPVPRNSYLPKTFTS